MKNLFKILIIIFSVASCSKEKKHSIVGTWRLSAIYTEQSPGNLMWHEINPYGRTIILNLNKEGNYSYFSDVPEGHGKYIYNYSTGDLTMIRAANNSTYVNYVSGLDENYLTMHIKINDSVTVKERYLRAMY